MKWTEHIEQCQRAGLPDSAPLPHPDDVILDFRKGTVAIRGPMTKEEKVEWDKKIACRTDAQNEVTYFAAECQKARNPAKKERWLTELHYEQRIFDLINDSMPDRYKVKLVNRSWHPDASREGKTLQEYLERRKRRKKTRRGA